MAQRRKHPKNCAKAIGETCQCGHCAGAKHGWVEAFELANGERPEDLHELERDVELRWSQECAKQDAKQAPQKRKHPKPTLDHQRAAVDSARVGLIKRFLERRRRRARPRTSETRLQEGPQYAEARAPRDPEESREPDSRPPAEAANRSTELREGPESDPASTDRALATATSDLQQAEAVGHMLGQVLDEVERTAGPLRPETRRAMAEHFWCELLVQLVLVIEESNHLLNAVPRTVTAKITESYHVRMLSVIDKRVITACVRQVWKRLTDALGLTVITDAKPLLPALRVLALLTCKSPPRHPEVVRRCADPLRTLLLHETKERLKRAFGEEVPHISSELSGDGPPAQPE
ncbi:hypothetical protein [Salinifilum ghardaiensis]